MTDKQKKGCGCSNIPISVILIALGGGYWWLIPQGNIKPLLALAQKLPIPQFTSPKPTATQPPVTIAKPEPIAKLPVDNRVLNPPKPKPSVSPSPTLAVAPKTSPSTTTTVPQTPWEKKVIRGIYLSRYQVTNNASEETIRKRVRYFHSQGINTIIHGVWGNGCTMYKSEVMQKFLGYQSCPNQFQDKWLDWTIDEASKHGMQVHAYFEKGIKIDKNSPIFNWAISKKWLVPGVDRTYDKIEHYVLDVEVPEVATFFRNIVTEFVTKYPKINAVQWDDYLGYNAELPGKVDRTAKLTVFVQQTIADMKKANPNVSFDLCHHNPYWAKKYFAADWEKWKVDRVFIQAYNDANFQTELEYATTYAGISITDNQLPRLKDLVANNKLKSILIFPLAGNPEQTASTLKGFYSK
jgi:uncharacterized lipoprotein YddW (UPF0748 family)